MGFRKLMGVLELPQEAPSPGGIRKRQAVAMSALVVAVVTVVAAVLPILWTDSYPVRPVSASMVFAGAGLLCLCYFSSVLLPAGTRAREFTVIGSGMVGMALLLIGGLTIIEIYRPVSI